MTIININKPIPLGELLFNIEIDAQTPTVPEDVSARVDAVWDDFVARTVRMGKQEPTKGEICVLQSYDLEETGLKGQCTIATFDQVLYFARAQIKESDYILGKERVGFPIASWGIIVSKDNRILLVRKRGAEGAYLGSPHSGFGSLVSASKDSKDGRISPVKLLERSIGKEVGNAIWERRENINYLGLNAYDENSKKVNNGYDSIWEVKVDAPISVVHELLTDNSQFESKKKASDVAADPRALLNFMTTNKLTMSGLSGLFSYIGSKFGEDDLRAEHLHYKAAMGEEAKDLLFKFW